MKKGKQMMICYLLIIGVLLVIYLKAKKDMLKNNYNLKNNPLDLMAQYLFKQKKLYENKNSRITKKIKEELESLEPTENSGALEQQYYVGKIKLVLSIVIVGTILALLMYSNNHINGELENGNKILRNQFGNGNKTTHLIANIENNQEIIKEEIIIEINEKEYEERELQELYDTLLEQIDTIILGENKSIDLISTDMNLVEYLQDYPFSLEWETSDFDLITSSGEVGEKEPLETGELVELTLHVTYKDWKQSYLFYITRVPFIQTKEVARKESLLSLLENEDSQTKEKAYFVLPAKIGGHNLTWEEEKIENSYMMLGLSLMAAVMVVIGKDRELHSRVELRKKQMLMDYPEIISKLLLLLSAGMTIRTAFDKIAKDYIVTREQIGKRYAYEEIMIMYYEIQSGVLESKAYENFGRRCKEPHYMKLTTLLSQSTKKGGSGLLDTLRNQVTDALEERKNNVRKEGEEASTKLLLPMMLMLLIVMIVIIVPAFMSFNI